MPLLLLLQCGELRIERQALVLGSCGVLRSSQNTNVQGKAVRVLVAGADATPMLDTAAPDTAARVTCSGTQQVA
jgi:hypothetical protein